MSHIDDLNTIFKTPMITKNFTDGEGNPVSAHIQDMMKVSDTKSITCYGVLDETEGVKINSPEGLKKVKSYADTLKEDNTYYVDYKQGIMFFSDNLIGQDIFYDCHITGIPYMSCGRVYTNIDTHGNIQSTIEDDTAKLTEVLTYLKSLPNLDQKVNEINNSIDNVNICSSTLGDSIVLANTTSKNLEDKTNDGKRINDILNETNTLAIIANTNLISSTSEANEIKNNLQNIKDSSESLYNNFNTTINTANNTIKNLQSLDNTANELLLDLSNENNEAKDYISSLTSKNSTAETNITSLTTQNTNATTNTSNLTSENTKATNNISELTSKNNEATQRTKEINDAISNSKIITKNNFAIMEEIDGLDIREALVKNGTYIGANCINSPHLRAYFMYRVNIYRDSKLVKANLLNGFEEYTTYCNNGVWSETWKKTKYEE